MSKPWRWHGEAMNWTTHEQVINLSWSSHEQVMKISQKSCEQLANKSLTSCKLLAADYIDSCYYGWNYYSGSPQLWEKSLAGLGLAWAEFDKNCE